MRFFVTSLTSWDEIPRARHQVTEALLRAGHEVLFVEKNRCGLPRICSREEKPGLTVISPGFPVVCRYRYRLPLVNEFYQLWLFSRLKKKWGDALVVNFDFTAHLLPRFFKRVVYYCNDEYIGNSSSPCFLVDAYHRFAERRVTARSVFCVSTAVYLTRKLSRDNPRVYEIPLGGPPPQVRPEDRCFEKRKPITVGLMGALKAGHVSPDIINRLLEEPDFRVVCIGNAGDKFRKAVNPSGQIEFKGVLTGDALFREMAAFDVALAPYNLKMINAGVTPNKLFQYLACACPVVISAIPNIRGVTYPPGTVYVVDAEEKFAERIRQAVSEDCPDYATVRLQYAAANTWDRRIELFLSHLEENNLME